MTLKKRKDAKLFTWASSTPKEIALALKTIAPYVPALQGGKDAVKLYFEQDLDAQYCSVTKEAKGFVIHYGKMNMALRMAGNVISGIIPEKEEYCPFTMFGIMLDCSRNSVMKFERMKEYFAQLAILGYNMMMLYTEDTYQIKEFPYFGFMRGAFSQKEIREIDDYCAKLGLEMIPCIQTLGHLAEALQWRGKYGDVADTDHVLLVDSEDTYKFIEAMIKVWAECKLHSNRMHIGMDETWGLGSGRYRTLHGEVRNHTELLTRHLARVQKICEKYGFKPMLWSDMFFRLASKTGNYYDPKVKMTDKVIKMMPKGVQLVYWDYYTIKQELYAHFIKEHQKLAGEPLMGSGVWTWNKFWYDREITERTVRPCLKACREAKLTEVFFTMWGDDGGFCDYGSAMAGLAFASELAFTGEEDHDKLNRKFDVIFQGANYDNIVAAAETELTDFITGLDGPERILWDDPLMMMLIGSHKFYDKVWMPEKLERYSRLSKAIAKMPRGGTAGDMNTVQHVCDAVLAKLVLCNAALDAYFARKGKKEAMKKVLPLVTKYQREFRKFEQSMRDSWVKNNKPFGLETLQLRCAGQAARIQELKLRLTDFANGTVSEIPEFDELKRVREKIGLYQYLRLSHASVIV